MKRPFQLLISALLFQSIAICGCASAPQDQPKLLTRVTPLPKALDPDFEFRKAKLFLMSEAAPRFKQQKSKNAKNSGDLVIPKSTSADQAAAVAFERQYRLFGAVTNLDRHQRFGDYFDFFWRARRPANLIVRLEYRQEKLHAHVQAQEVSYPDVHGNQKTEFKVVGDDYFDGGRVIAWRCLLVANGRIVAERRSALWN